MTFFLKFILPPLGGFLIATVFKTIREAPLSLIAVALGIGFLYWCYMRIKEVWLKDNVLIVSNFRKKIVIPLCDIERVSGSIWVSPELVWLHLRRPTDFGTKIIFTPKWRFLSGFTWHPTVRELQKLTEGACAHPPQGPEASKEG
jgi:hypothetical protein